MKNLFVAFCLFISSFAYAETSFWVTSGLLSHHDDRTRHYNERNTGMGFEVEFTDTSTLVGGSYNNSLYRESDYIGYRWTPYNYYGIKPGITALLITGYSYDCTLIGDRDKLCRATGRASFVPVPTLTYEYKRIGINLYVVPLVVTAAQIKFRF